eukprot:6191704-Pleurochrysis_carterae.AAC.2
MLSLPNPIPALNPDPRRHPWTLAAQGDVIRAVEGVICSTIEEVTQMVIRGAKALRLSVCRRPVTVVLESEIKMKMPSGEWEPFAFRLLSNRNIEFEKLSPPVYAGEIHARLAQVLHASLERGRRAPSTPPRLRLSPARLQRSRGLRCGRF